MKVFDRLVATALGIVLLYYAYAKFADHQFGHFEFDGKVRDLPASDLVWYFYGYSRPYAMFIATGELIAGLLVLIPRTARIGYPIYFMVAINIVVIDWSFGIGISVQILSTALATGALYLMIRERRVYARLLETAR